MVFQGSLLGDNIMAGRGESRRGKNRTWWAKVPWRRPLWLLLRVQEPPPSAHRRRPTWIQVSGHVARESCAWGAVLTCPILGPLL